MSLSFDGKPSPDHPDGVTRRHPDTTAERSNPQTPTLLRFCFAGPAFSQVLHLPQTMKSLKIYKWKHQLNQLFVGKFVKLFACRKNPHKCV